MEVRHSMTKLFKFAPAIVGFFLTSAFAQAQNESGVGSKEVLVGMVNNTSGPTATSGLNFNAGPRAYFEQLNKAGGIHGRLVAVKYYDDAYEPEKAAAETKRAIQDDHVFVIMNNNGTPTAKAALPIAKRANVPFLFPRTGDMSVREPFDPLIFNWRSSFGQEITALVKHAVAVEKKKRIAILTQTDAFGTSIRSAALKALRDHNLGSFAAEGEVPRNSVEVEKALEKIESGNPDVVILGVTQAAAVPFLKLAATKKKTWIYLSANNNNPIAEKLSDAEIANVIISQVTPNPDTSSLMVAKKFREDMKATGNEKFLNPIAFEGYINAWLFADVLRTAGPQPTRASLIKAFETKPYDVGGLKIKFSSQNHNADLPVQLTRVKGGKFHDI